MVNNKTLLWLGRVAGRHKFILVILLLLQTVISGGAVCYALVMKNMIDDAIAHNENGFVIWLGLFTALILIQLLLRILLRYLEEYTRSGLENSFKERLFHSLLTKDYRQVMGVHSEEWMNRMTSDTTVCANGLTEIVPGFLGMAVRLCGALIMICILLPKLAYIMIPCGIVFLLITGVFRKYLKHFHKRVQEKDGELRVYLQERISSMLVLRTFGAEDVTMQEAKNRMVNHRRARMKKGILSNLCNTGFAAAMNGMYLIGIGYCGYGILNDFVSYGTLTAIIQLIGQLQAPLAGISGFVPRYYAMLASAERLMEIEEYKEANPAKVNSPGEARELYAESLKSLVFEDVSFSYEPDVNVLQSMNLSFEKGDYIAFTGLSGCGKSTLLKLLMGIYKPDKGNICIVTGDNRKLPVNEWRRLFAYVPQGNYLMGGTIEEVITFGSQPKRKASMTIEKALELACAEFVFELPDTVNTLLGERGMGLSEGQMQRIAIARALYTDAPILILDEATSALDEVTEKRLLEKLKQLTDKTVLIVTHRTAALEICNKQICVSDVKML